MTSAVTPLAPNAKAPEISRFIDQARNILGDSHVDVSDGQRRLYSTDFSEIQLATAAAVLRPNSTEDIVALVKAARETGVALTARGGGMSYTLGYVPSRDGSAVVDMGRMNRIVRMDTENLFVCVEPGVTWAELYDALAPTGYRPGMMGTMSGIAATIGGGLGNNATAHGRGEISDDLMGMEVVLGDGRVVHTGAVATNLTHPTLRSYGPDFSGVFTHDAGAFGIKTKIWLRLMRRPQGTAFLCYGFQDVNKLAAAMCDIERLGITSSNMAFSHYHHRVFAEQSKPSADEAKAMAKAVFATASSRRKGLMNFLSLARPSGLNFLLKWQYSTFGIVDAFDQTSADRMARAAEPVMGKYGGVKLPTGLGVAIRAQPFMPIEKLMIGIENECTFPSNCGIALSRAQELIAVIDGFFKANETDMARHKVTWTRLFLTFKGAFGVEPIIYWHDKPNPLRLSKIAPQRRARFEALDEQPEARAYAVDLRRRLITEVDKLHPYHFQIGKYYDYRNALQSPAAWDLLRDFKSNVDPTGIMNPGAVSLGT